MMLKNTFRFLIFIVLLVFCTGVFSSCFIGDIINSKAATDTGSYTQKRPDTAETEKNTNETLTTINPDTEQTQDIETSSVGETTDATTGETTAETGQQTEPIVIEPADLEGSAFMGNSIVTAFQLYGFLKGCDVYSRAGFNILSAMKEPYDSGSEITALDELKGKEYKRVVLLFGLNEMGWPSAANFCNEYKKLIQKIQEYEPGIPVYVLSITPITATASSRGDNGATNPRIMDYNEAIKKMLNDMTGVYYVDIWSLIIDKDCCLPEDKAAKIDGIHPLPITAGEWIDIIRNEIGKIEN